MSALPKMAGVFEVEVDGVEHDHGHGHHDEAVQVPAAPHVYSQSRSISPSETRDV